MLWFSARESVDGGQELHAEILRDLGMVALGLWLVAFGLFVRDTLNPPVPRRPGGSAMSNALEFDVAIIGGGPAGATAGGFLLKHNPELRVGIFEREQFPRDHVGESQLPPIPFILDELGCWDKVEAANFPIKVGATYRWGKCPELWHLEFFPFDEFKEEARPAKFEGQRQRTAFQVDRSIYDKILLDHAESLGCEVFEGTKVTS